MNDTKGILLELSNKYINSRTNEQATMNIYFNCIKVVWEPIKTRVMIFLKEAI
jgi:hypothetical protein